MRNDFDISSPAFINKKSLKNRSFHKWCSFSDLEVERVKEKIVVVVASLLLSACTSTCPISNSVAKQDLFTARGCCSWHGGVAGCSGGRVVCRDGTTSPSCRCFKDSPVTSRYGIASL